MKKILPILCMIFLLVSCTGKKTDGFLTSSKSENKPEPIVVVKKEKSVDNMSAEKKVSVYKEFKRRRGFGKNSYEYFDKYRKVYIKQAYFLSSSGGKAYVRITTTVRINYHTIHTDIDRCWPESLKENLEKEFKQAIPNFRRAEKDYKIIRKTKI